MTSQQGAGNEAGEPRRRLLPRAKRREQIIGAAKHAFVRSGFAATGLEDVAEEAGITKVLIYRHFNSKADLYQAVLDDTRTRMRRATGSPDQMGEETFDALVSVAREDPDGFRLLFRHAAREPEFRAYAEEFQTRMTATAERVLNRWIPDPERRQWASRLIPAVTQEALMTWLDAGQPEPERAAATILGIVNGVLAVLRKP